MTLSQTRAQKLCKRRSLITRILRVVLVASVAVLVSAGGAWIAPPPAHACTCKTSTVTTGSGGYNTAKSSNKKPTTTGGSGGSGSSSGTSSPVTGGSSSTSGTSTPVTGGSSSSSGTSTPVSGGSGSTSGGGTTLHVTSASRLPASTGVWSSGGLALGGILGGANSHLPASGRWAEDTPCLTMPATVSPVQCSSVTATTNTGCLSPVPGVCSPAPKFVCSVNCDNSSAPVQICSVGCSPSSDPPPAVAVSSPVTAGVPVETPKVVPERPVVDSGPISRVFAVVLMSSVGTGFSAVIIILILLTIGIWYFGHRVAVQLAIVEKRNA